MATVFFAPRISADTEGFWRECKAHRLTAQRCADCGKIRWPAAYLCPDCLSEKTETADLGDRGSLYSFVVFRRPFHPTLKEKLPYVVATVDIGGVRIVSNIVGCDPAALRCGTGLGLVWADGETYTRPVFQLLEE